MNTKKSAKEIGYILWEYYRWHILIAALIVVFVISFSFFQRNKPSDTFTIFIVNGYSNDLAEQFSDHVTIEASQTEILVEHLFITENISEESYASMQKISAYAASQQLDVATMDFPLFSAYAQEGLFADLRTCLSTDILSSLEGTLYYTEASVFTASQQGGYTQALVSKDASIFSAPVPIGIDCSESLQFKTKIDYSDSTPCIGIISSSEHKELAVELIEYLVSK